MTEAGFSLWMVIPATLLLVCAGVLALIGSLGLLRLPDFYSRMHPPTMATTLASSCVAIASMCLSSARAHGPVVHELLIILFVIMTSPVTAMLLMRAAVYRSGAAIEEKANGQHDGVIRQAVPNLAGDGSERPR